MHSKFNNLDDFIHEEGGNSFKKLLDDFVKDEEKSSKKTEIQGKTVHYSYVLLDGCCWPVDSIVFNREVE